MRLAAAAGRWCPRYRNDGRWRGGLGVSVSARNVLLPLATLTALRAVQRFPASHWFALELSPTGGADECFHLMLRWLRDSRNGRSRCGSELLAIARCPLSQVLHGFWSGCVVPVHRDASRPPQRLLEVPGFLLAYRHLPVGLQPGHLAPLGHEGLPDSVHFRVVLAACLVVLLKGPRRRRRVTGTAGLPGGCT